MKHAVLFLITFFGVLAVSFPVVADVDAVSVASDCHQIPYSTSSGLKGCLKAHAPSDTIYSCARMGFKSERQINKCIASHASDITIGSCRYAGYKTEAGFNTCIRIGANPSVIKGCHAFRFEKERDQNNCIKLAKNKSWDDIQLCLQQKPKTAPEVFNCLKSK